MGGQAQGGGLDQIGELAKRILMQSSGAQYQSQGQPYNPQYQSQGQPWNGSVGGGAADGPPLGPQPGPQRPRLYEDGTMNNPFGGPPVGMPPRAQGQPRDPVTHMLVQQYIKAMLQQLQQGNQRRQINRGVTPWR